MSYRQCVFAFPVAIGRAQVIELARRAVRTLVGELEDAPPIFLLVSDEAAIERDGAVLLAFATTRADERVLDREFFVDVLPAPFSVILHDDHHGRFLFRHHATDGFSLASEGATFFGDTGRIGAARPGGTAISEGASLVYGRCPHYLGVLDTATALRVFDPEQGVDLEEVPAPLALRNYVDPALGPDWQRAYEPPAPRPTGIVSDALAEEGRRLIPTDPQEAVRALTRVLEVAPRHPVARYNRACAHARLGDRAAMLADLAAAIEVNPADAADAAADTDFAAFCDDAAFRGLAGLAPSLPAGLVLRELPCPDEGYHVARVGTDGVVILRASPTPPRGAVLAELSAVPLPMAIERGELEAYAGRLTDAVAASSSEYSLSILALARVERGLVGFACGTVAVFWVADGERVTANPYLVLPGLPPHLTDKGITRDGVVGGEWFEERGREFAITVCHPLPDLDGPLVDLDDLATRVARASAVGAGVVGWWIR